MIHYISIGLSNYFNQNYCYLISNSDFKFQPEPHIKQSPFHIKFAIYILTMLFLFHCFIKTGKLFNALSYTKKYRIIQSWQFSNINLFRKFIQLFQSIFLLQCLDSYETIKP